MFNNHKHCVSEWYLNIGSVKEVKIYIKWKTCFISDNTATIFITLFLKMLSTFQMVFFFKDTLICLISKIKYIQSTWFFFYFPRLSELIHYQLKCNCCLPGVSWSSGLVTEIWTTCHSINIL